VLLLVVWIVVAVLAVVVLGGIAYGVVGAVARLRRELEAAERDLRPLLAQVEQTMSAVERTREQAAAAR